MEKKRHHYIYIHSFLLSLVFSLALLAFFLSILAEFNKAKEEDVKLDGKFCELPGSKAFEFGVAALICFSTAQMIGNSIVLVGFCTGSSGERRPYCQINRWIITTALLIISWCSFGIGAMVMGTATSMNKKQSYGEGWVNGECYLVKDGVFIVAAILDLLSLACTSAATFITVVMTN